MVLPLGQGIEYGSDVKIPHVVNATLAVSDFMDVAVMGGLSNNLPHPDAYDATAISNGPATLTQFGYLGYKATFDIGTAMRSQGMSFVQSVYIDNSEGLGVLILKSNSDTTITVPPCHQGVYPLIIPRGAFTSFECAYVDSDNNAPPSFGAYPDVSPILAGGGGLYGIPALNAVPVKSGHLRFQFTDVTMPIGQWSCRNAAVARWVDYSAGIAVGGVFQVALPSNPFRKGFIIANPGNAVELLYVDLHQFGSVGTIANSIALTPGQYYKEVLPEPAYTLSVHVSAATLGHQYVAKAKF